MSWWDAKGFTSLASQALKTAQKKIDKVLDIEEDKATKNESKESVPLKEEGSNSWNSWNSWLPYRSSSGDEKVEVKEDAAESTEASSWSTPWDTQEPQLSLKKSQSASVSAKMDGVLGNSSVLSTLPFKSVSAPRKSVPKRKKADSASKDKTVEDAEQLSVKEFRVDTDTLPLKSTIEDSVNESAESSSVPSDLMLQEANSSKSDEQHGKKCEVERAAADALSNIHEYKNKYETASLTVHDSTDHQSQALLETHIMETPTQNIEDFSGTSIGVNWDKKASPQFSEESFLESGIREGQDEKGVQLEQSNNVHWKETLVLNEVPINREMDVERQDAENRKPVSQEESQEQNIKVETSVIEVVSSTMLEVDALQTSAETRILDSNHEPQTDVSVVAKSREETEETMLIISRDSSKDALESFDMMIPLSDCAPEVCGESSCSNVALVEDMKAVATSITSSSSEAVLLSLSSEEASLTQAEYNFPDVDVFSPQSHSSLVQEEGEEKSPLFDVFSPSSQSSLVQEEDEEKSPPFDSSVVLEKLPAGGPQVDSTTTVSSNDSSEASRLDSSMDTVVDKGQLQTEFEEEICDEADSEQWLGVEHPVSGLLADADSSSPSASFVKCLIEEAMEEGARVEDSSSDNHSEEKSESSKIDSELEKSTHSGLESSDEIETTTSSDIEIISTPTPNGEKNIVDLSPLKFSLQKAASSRSHVLGHQRSDSQSSSSTHSKGDDQLSPERDSDQERHVWQREGKTQHHTGAATGNDDLDNPQHPQRLLKKLAEMAEILQARETKLVQLSRDNNDLLETNSILRSQLQQLEEAREAEMTDLHTLTEEFSRRMGDAERRLQNVLKEKEILKQQLQVAEQQLAKRAGDVKLQDILVEKDEQIAGLMEEGEKLSKQQLQNSNIIKKLRVKEKENETTIATQKKKIDQQADELEHLKNVLDSKDEMEKKQTDAIKLLNSAVQMLEKEKAKLSAEIESANEKIRGFQATLDNSYKEIAELHKSNAAQDSKAQAAALSAEMQVREELKMAMEQEQQRFKHQRDTLIMQIEDLQLSMTRMEKEHNRREELLKQEIADLQMRLQEDESRNQDLTQSVTSATRPLLRQIENLRATHSIQASSWEMVEKNLTDRLSEAQTLLALAQERERAATEKLAEMTSRCVALEATNAQLRHDKAQLLTHQESDRRRIDTLEERKASDIAQLELAKQKLFEEVAALKKDQVFLESQLEIERSRLEAERQRVAVAEEQIRMLERERPRSRGSPSPVSVSRQESMNNSFSEHTSTPIWSLQRSMQDEFETNLTTPPGPKVSVYESLRQSGAAAIMENLQAQLKLREGEIAQLQADIQQLERTRESMARELVSLTNRNEELQEHVLELPILENKYKELDARYNALLQMYGEKEEQVQELKLDLQDVKDMYKSQINALMPK
ncbi:TATA element modulatory factor-like isoform X2 [Pomacea canaliculata]|uniref:TATA element modulatory factor-like isoform X2 n=1 Tax=Pomacea canaliculata TaxID=400727 RepID=UPI000D73755B|nr:TATA element modulatory factor-like isoform X2 [Pomacea canaliculata]